MRKLRGSEKLTLLADFLGGVPDKNYWQDSWGYTRHDCQTVGCAMGWGGIALSDKLGYAYDADQGNFTVEGVTLPAQLSGFDVAKRVFGISLTEAHRLFGGRPATRCEKIAELRAFARVLEKRENTFWGKIKRIFG